MKNKPVLIAVLDTYPSLSETFLTLTLKNLQSKFHVTILAKKKGNTSNSKLKVKYLPSEYWPFPIKLLVLFGNIFRSFIIDPTTSMVLLKSIRKNNSLREGFQILYRTLPIIYINGQITYFPFGEMAARYVDYIKTKQKVIFSLRGTDISITPLIDINYRKKLIDCLRYSSAIHCVCDYNKKVAEDIIGHHLEKATVIHTAVEKFITKKQDNFPKSSKYIITSVGRLDWKKGYEHGIKAIFELRRRGYKIIWRIVGEGEYRIPLQWAIRDMDLVDTVFLEGPKSHDLITDNLKYSDAFFLPSVSEGISNAVVEAMSVGIPVVSTNVGGMPELILDGETGLLVPPRDWKAMAEALERLIKDHEFSNQLVDNAYRHISENFNLKRHINLFNKLFESV